MQVHAHDLPAVVVFHWGLPCLVETDAEALGDVDVPGERRRLLTAVIGGVRRPKLQLGADLEEFWHRVILDGQPLVDGAPLAAQRRLSRAAEFVEDHLAEARAGCVGDREYRTWLRRLSGKITNALQFTLYVVGDDSDVGVIFETLNQRGKDLTELEKTKNYLLYLASLLPDGPRQQLATTVNESWRTIFANLGAAQLGPAHEDQLLRAHWLATQNPRQREWEQIRSVKARFHRTRYRTDKALLLREVTGYAYSLREASAAYRDTRHRQPCQLRRLRRGRRGGPQEQPPAAAGRCGRALRAAADRGPAALPR